MNPRNRWVVRDDTDEQSGIDRQSESLGALTLLLVLVVAGLFLVRTLSSKAAIEDCLMAGRRNCDAVAIAHPPPQLW